MKKVLFIDRDGTLIKEPADEQIDAFEKLEFLPGVFYYLRRIRELTDFELVMVSNQDGLGTSSFPEETFWPVHDFILKTLQGEGITFDAIHIDRHFPEDNAPTRKPGTGMLTAYMQGDYDLAHSYVIGDRATDAELAHNLGCTPLILDGEQVTWKEVAERIIGGERTAELEQIAHHGGVDLTICVKGDLQVDEHHTMEDTALALGDCLRQCLGDKRGIGRYGFTLPMDDCLCQVALDFGGRPWLVWNADFKRERIGDVPTEMFLHFFKSLSDTARMNLNVQADGENEHHKIEGIFKAFARAIRMAVRRDFNHFQLPSSKGQL